MDTDYAHHQQSTNNNILEPKQWSDPVDTPVSQENYNNHHHHHNHHHYPYDASRRHSISVGEMPFHSFDAVKQEMEMRPWDVDLHHILGTSLPSSFSSESTYSTLDANVPPALHRRAMSLRLETSPHSTTSAHRSSVSTASPTSPAFFSPSFLDAMKEDDIMETDLNLTYPEPHPSFIAPNHVIGQDYLLENNNPELTTIQPSALDAQVSTLTQWLLHNNQHPLEEQQQFQPQQQMPPLATVKTEAKLASPPTSPSNASSISTSPSPPITPLHANVYDTVLFQQQHPSIPEEDEDMDIKIESSNQLVQGDLQSLIRQYLTSPDPSLLGEHKITMLTSKVAQKSYGTEKRFLCPPPTTILSGASWCTGGADNMFPNSKPELTIQITGEQTSQNGVLEWTAADGTLLDHSNPAFSYGDTSISARCVSKQLHISDADEKRKRVQVLAKIQLGNKLPLGTVASKGIKVISKPSKKRQSLKNMELCIHHGTTISLFNRIRSQTVSTKYLGVSNSQKNGTCFVARTSSWDPFVIWIVDTAGSPPKPVNQNVQFPAPPAIALPHTPGQSPIAVHYNQPVVLQCVTTGLVSPVMIIRKVDKGSMVLGGNRVEDLRGATGGEYGDEALGDPVSQLHKIAFQIVQDPSIAHNNKANYHPDQNSPLPAFDWILPESSPSITYLACLNDVVGMHKTNAPRQFVAPCPQPTTSMEKQSKLSSSWSSASSFDAEGDFLSSIVSQQHDNSGGGKVTRKRRVSCDVKPMSLPNKLQNSLITNSKNRRRVNSLDANSPIKIEGAGRRHSLFDRRSSTSSDNGTQTNNGACWTEDVSDASVWTIVGTDSAVQKFLILPQVPSAFNGQERPPLVFPSVLKIQEETQEKKGHHLIFTGENFTRDMTIWFGDVQALNVSYKNRESIQCTIPPLDTLQSSPTVIHDGFTKKLPVLFLRDGVVYNSDLFYKL